jgi:hypothetical protein
MSYHKALAIEDLNRGVPFTFADVVAKANANGGHPRYPITTWIDGVVSGEILIGYWDWVVDCMAEDAKQSDTPYARKHWVDQVVAGITDASYADWVSQRINDDLLDNLEPPSTNHG